METKLGIGKVYLKAQDIGKMLKLKNVENLVITNVNIKDSKDLEIEVATPICNKTNNRIRDFKENKTYHIGLDLANNKGISISVFEKFNKKYILKTLTKDSNLSIVEVVDNFKDILDNCIFYVDNWGFGNYVRDNLISLGIKEENIITIYTKIYSIDKQKLLEIAKDLKVKLFAKQEYLKLIKEIKSLDVSVISGKLRLKNNQPSGLMEVFFMPLIDNIN